MCDAIDNGGYVEDKRDCPHVRAAASVAESQLTVEAARRALETPCEGCASAEENWCCYSCRTVLCSRYVAGHMVQHRQTEGHQVAFSLRDLSSWCFACESYVISRETEAMRIAFYVAKFGSLPPFIDPCYTDAEVSDDVLEARVAEAQSAYPAPRPLTPNRMHFADEPADPAAERVAAEGPDPFAGSDNVLSSGAGMPNFGHATAEAIREFADGPETIAAKAREVAALLRASRCAIAVTGAGISTSAAIPDYRGPRGVWTLAARGQRAVFGVRLDEAVPTPTHELMTELCRSGRLHRIITTNVDGLHAKAGAGDSCIELHGSIFRERCERCPHIEIHATEVRGAVGDDGRRTGRVCARCGGAMRDSIIHFGESLEARFIEPAVEAANAADLALALGTSLMVQPACGLIEPAFRNGGHLVVVNLQATKYDRFARVRVWAKTDDFAAALSAALADE